MTNDSENDLPANVPDADPLSKSLSGAAGDIFKRLLGPSADVVGKYLAGEFRAWIWRRKNLNDILEKCEAEIKQIDLSPEELIPIPEGDAYRGMIACSLEDDESVQKLWAGLFASAMDPNNQVSVSKAFVEILRAIGPVEAGLMLVIQKINATKLEPEDRSAKAHFDANKKAIEELSAFADRVWRRHPHPERDIAIQNVMRLRCVGFRGGKQLRESDLRRRLPLGESGNKVPATFEFTARAFDYVETLALAASGTGDMRKFLSTGPKDGRLSEAIYDFTPLGRSLIEACVRDLDRFENLTSA